MHSSAVIKHRVVPESIAMKNSLPLKCLNCQLKYFPTAAQATEATLHLTCPDVSIRITLASSYLKHVYNAYS